MTDRVTVDCGGRPAEVEIVGHGPDVVIVGAAVPMMWAREAATELAECGFRVTNFDYGSSWEDPQPRSALKQAEDVRTVMTSLGIGRASLLGLSRGAMTAYWQAVTHPETVDSLVLVFPVAGFSDTLGSPEAGTESGVGTLEDVLDSLFTQQFLKQHRNRALELISTPPGSVARLDRADEEPFPAHSEVSCPVLIIEGSDDVVVSAEHPARYLSASPGAQHVVVPHARHGWLMEEPADFADIVAKFLSSRG